MILKFYEMIGCGGQINYEKLYIESCKQIADKEKERLYWQQRCEAAEQIISPVAYCELPEHYENWKQLKDQKPKEE